MQPETTPIAAVVPDLFHLQKWNDMHGDTADPFWADDDNLYHFTCDGRGFGKQPRNVCFNKLTGPDPLYLKGSLVNSMDEYGKANDTGQDGATWKVTGQECIDLQDGTVDAITFDRSNPDHRTRLSFSRTK